MLCLVYYLKATFGSSTGDAVLEIPVSVTGGNKYFIIYYLLFSSKTELAVKQRKGGRTEDKTVMKYVNQRSFDGWNEHFFLLDFDVEAIQLVARKTGITTNVELVLVDAVEITSAHGTGIIMRCSVSLLPLNDVSFITMCTNYIYNEITIKQFLHHVHYSDRTTFSTCWSGILMFLSLSIYENPKHCVPSPEACAAA